jgi:hypothetical protein
VYATIKERANGSEKEDERPRTAEYSNGPDSTMGQKSTRRDGEAQ